MKRKREIEIGKQNQFVRESKRTRERERKREREKEREGESSDRIYTEQVEKRTALSR